MVAIVNLEQIYCSGVFIVDSEQFNADMGWSWERKGEYSTYSHCRPEKFAVTFTLRWKRNLKIDDCIHCVVCISFGFSEII